MNSLILLPDDWSTSYYTLNNTNENNADFSSNIITATQWIALEQHGAVLLPAAGSRNGVSIHNNNSGVVGGYWSATFVGNAIGFSSNHVYDGSYVTGVSKCTGLSVRLVHWY